MQSIDQTGTTVMSAVDPAGAPAPDSPDGGARHRRRPRRSPVLTVLGLAAGFVASTVAAGLLVAWVDYRFPRDRVGPAATPSSAAPSRERETAAPAPPPSPPRKRVRPRRPAAPLLPHRTATSRPGPSRTASPHVSASPAPPGTPDPTPEPTRPPPTDPTDAPPGDDDA